MTSSKTRNAARVGIESRCDAEGREEHRRTVYDNEAGHHLRGPWTYSLADARGWRVTIKAKLQAGTVSAKRGPTVRQASGWFIATDGSVRNRSGRPYKPSAIRGYER